MTARVVRGCLYGLSSLSEKARKSNNCLQMSLRRRQFLLSYFKTLSVDPGGVLNHPAWQTGPYPAKLSRQGSSTCEHVKMFLLNWNSHFVS